MAEDHIDQKRCPSCGEPTDEGFDGANDMPYELCTRVRYRRQRLEDPPLDPLRCDFYAAPPRWLVAALAEAG